MLLWFTNTIPLRIKFVSQGTTVCWSVDCLCLHTNDISMSCPLIMLTAHCGFIFVCFFFLLLKIIFRSANLSISSMCVHFVLTYEWFCFWLHKKWHFGNQVCCYYIDDKYHVLSLRRAVRYESPNPGAMGQFLSLLLCCNSVFVIFTVVNTANTEVELDKNSAQSSFSGPKKKWLHCYPMITKALLIIIGLICFLDFSAGWI